MGATKLILAAAALGLGVVGVKYYSEVNSLSVNPSGVSWGGIAANGDITLNVRISINNPGALTIPVPTLTVDLYTGTQHLASGINNTVQYINGNTTSTLTLPVTFSVADVGGEIFSILTTQQLPPNLSIQGYAHLPFYNLPFSDQILSLS